VPDDIIADLKERLARVRLPDQLDGAGWDYGTERSYLEELCTYWRDSFDWRAAEVRFNRFAQFTTGIDGENVHFYHIRSPEPDALPLIITHGYPGSVAEFLDILGPLSDPASHGGDRRDAFHVIAPSIPGYGFSGPTRNKGFNIAKAAAVNDRIMELLGYDRYVAQGGDYGSAISSRMAMNHPERVIALHLNFIVGRPADLANPMAGLSEQEIAEQEWKRNYDAHESGYQAIQGTKPQSLAYGLTDSPAGLAAWIVEKFKTWSDCDGHIEQSYSKDHLLENIMLYWVTGTINSAMRFYYECIGPNAAPQDDWSFVPVPTAHARFPAEIRPTPRAWAEQMYNIVRWTKMAKGGHFAAFEQPGLFLADLREFCRDFR
jgi:microsomal epoxide hydrolase